MGGMVCGGKKSNGFSKLSLFHATKVPYALSLAPPKLELEPLGSASHATLALASSLKDSDLLFQGQINSQYLI